MRNVVAAVFALMFVGCESGKATPETDKQTAKPADTVPLTDLTAASSLGAVRTAFNAHKGKARFLTLLSPT